MQSKQPATSNYYTKPGQLQSFCEKVIPKPDDMDDLFTIRSANTWLQQANQRPVPKMLFGKFWFETELCILFADSNLGKSILAVQIANAISMGQSMEPFTCEAEMQPVLYCDFELTDKQFEARYSVEYEHHYDFNEHFYRAELNPGSEIPRGFKDFDEYLNFALERSIVQTKAKVIVIDNLTYLRSENERAKDALPLMKHLKALKNKYGLSILALAHTPKRDMGQEINRNDLQGSKMLMNFCDSAFTIGESMLDKSLRYLKQIKQRNTDQVYGTDNVCVCTITKPDNFLQYEFVEYGREARHLRKPKYDNEPDHTEEVLKLREEGLSLRDVAKKLGISYQKVDRLIQKAAQ